MVFEDKVKYNKVTFLDVTTITKTNSSID